VAGASRLRPLHERRNDGNVMTSTQLSYLIARERQAELQRVAECARLARDTATERRNRRDSNPISRLGAQLARLTARVAPSGV
jgi:hypothetical protein